MPVAATFLDDTEMRMNGSEGVFAFERRRHFKRSSNIAKDGDHKGITRFWGRRVPWQDWQDWAQAATAPSAPPYCRHPLLGLATVSTSAIHLQM